MSLPLQSTTDLREHLNRVLGEDLRGVNDVLRHQFRNPNALVRELCDHVGRFQGKQVRPMLVILAARLFGVAGERRAIVHQMGAVVELIHTATLVHDDVIDDADLRRHVSTIHRRWDTETSVLLGDYLFSKAFHLAATTGDAEACRLIGRATDRTCEGELNQIAARLEQSESERDYFRVIAGKTGQLFAVSCVLGGRAVRATAAEIDCLKSFGLRLGLAFQIADDVLDLTASRESTGKDAANDLHNKRLTLPLLRALRLADSDSRRVLRDLLDSDQPCDRRLLIEHPQVHAGVQSARSTAEELIQRAVRSLSRLPACEERNLLEAIARFSAHRSG